MLERLREDVAVVALSSRIAFDRLRAAEVRLLAIPRADKRGGRALMIGQIFKPELRVFQNLVSLMSRDRQHHFSGQEDVRDESCDCSKELG